MRFDPPNAQQHWNNAAAGTKVADPAVSRGVGKLCEDNGVGAEAVPFAGGNIIISA